MRLWSRFEIFQHAVTMVLTTATILYSILKLFVVPWPGGWLVVAVLVVVSAYTARYYWGMHKTRLARKRELDHLLNYSWLYKGVRYYTGDPDRKVAND